MNISSHPQSLYFPSQLSHELPQPGPLGLSSSAKSNRVSPETVSQSSENAEGEPIAIARWSRANVLLISCYAEQRERFKHKNQDPVGGNTKRARDERSVPTSKSCETKMKNLKRSYVACVDHSKVSRNDPKK